MNHQVLARKWRPKSFDQVVGQQHVLPALIHSLEQQRLHHAYLFTGTRGVGKTTLARIFAKCLNCEEGISATPCGTCSTCQEINAGNFIDLIEVDAASRTKVEDTRDLLDNVQYAPTRGRYKIYLIDEVHMLSNHSFNALLKTLEEPPKHVIFLLATTDPQKMPITVLSRCLQFHLKALTREQLSQYCQFVCREEKVTTESQAIDTIADSAHGSVRDALSLLDQAIVFSDSNITAMAVSNMLGAASHDIIWKILDSLAGKDFENLLTLSENMALENVDFNQVLQQLIELFHDIAVLQFSPTYQTANQDKLLHYAKELTKEQCQLAYQTLLIGQKDITLAPSAKMGFDMIIMRLLYFTTQAPQASATKQSITKHSVASAIKTKQAKAAATKAETNATTTENKNDWPSMLVNLNLTGMAQLVANNCSLASFNHDEIKLLLDDAHAPLLSTSVKQRIQEAIHRCYGENIKLKVELGSQTQVTPAREQEQQRVEKQQQAEEAINEDPNVKGIMQAFDANFDQSSVKTNTESGNN